MLIAFTQILVFYCLSEKVNFHFPPLTLVLLIISTLCIAAGGYIINDYFDVKIDVINKPSKLVVDKFLSRRWTLFLHLSFTFSGIILGYFVSPFFALINLLNASLLGLYSARFKYKLLIGNLVISLLISETIPVVRFAHKQVLWQWLLLYFGFAFLTGLVREILKDIEDMAGDEAYGCKTLPIVFGVYKTKTIIEALLILSAVVLCFFILFSLQQGHILLSVWIVLLVLIPLLYMFYRMRSADKKIDFTSLSSSMKLIMLSGTLSMLFKLLK